MINVKFEVIDIESQIETLKSFIERGDDTAKFVAESLGLAVSSISQNFEKRIEELYNKNLDAMQKSCVVFQRVWDDKKDFINQEFIKVFGRAFDFDCVARVNLNPIMPRFLKNKTFDINFECDEDFSLLTTCHEIAHFAWFELLAENFPHISVSEYEYPSPVWLASEIAIEPILGFQNCTPFRLLALLMNISIHKKLAIAQLLKRLIIFTKKAKILGIFKKRCYNFLTNKKVKI